LALAPDVMGDFSSVDLMSGILAILELDIELEFGLVQSTGQQSA
jgi:hypothetical protein